MEIYEKNADRNSPAMFGMTEMSQKNDSATIYRGTIRNQTGSVGEFVARIDWRGRTLFIEELFIKREYRGKGLGKRALDFLVAKASCLKLREVVLEPFPNDLSANAFESLRNWYVKQGFIPRRKSILAPSTRLLSKAVW